VVSLSTFSVPRKQLFFQIPIKAFSNAIALQLEGYGLQPVHKSSKMNLGFSP
jgi:hypothetical protein